MWIKLRYPVLHWLLTIVLGPVLFVFTPAVAMENQPMNGAMEFLLIMVVYGFVFSLPTLLVYMLVYGWVKARSLNTWLTKALLDIVVLVCMGASMALIGGYMMPYLFAYYALAVVISSLLVKL